MIYLDNSATTKQYDEVTEIMVESMKTGFGNPSSLYQLGLDAEKTIKAARNSVLRAAFGETVSKGGYDAVFTSGGTEADNMAIFGTARLMQRQGKRIVTTAVEHPAVLECCRALEAEGFEVVYVGVDRYCRPDMEQLERAINGETILVTMMQVNNETGTVMPIAETREIMRRKGAPGLLHCDGVQSFGKMLLPREADLISISGHKIHGPKGSGALIIRKGKTPGGRNISIPPFILGGGQEQGRRSGTENVPAIAGLGKAAEMAASDMYREAARMAAIREKIMTGLEANLKDITINSIRETGSKPGMCCPSVLSISFGGTRGEVLLHTLEQEGIFVSTGSACSSNKKGGSHVLKAMGLKDREIEGTLRFSLGRFNTEDETDAVIEKVTAAVSRFRRLGSFR
ncbi:MAG: cysteine desulfurase family protein [Lentihominibacter sp.]